MRAQVLLDEDYQEVREFAAKQNSESYLAAENIAPETPPKQREEAEEGMERMSEVYRETGSELYIGSGGREHD